MSDPVPVLLISYYFPPAGGPGVQRVLKFCKFLPQFGFRPFILTVKNGEFPAEDPSLEKDIPPGTVINRTFIPEPYAGYKLFTGMKKSEKTGVAFVKKGSSSKESWKEKLSVWIRGNLFVPDARVLWRFTAVPAGIRLVKKEKIPVIFSSGPPHSVHLTAMAISKKTGCAWVADFRDPWTGIDYYQKLRLTLPADRLHHRLERKVLQTATDIVVVSESMKTDFSRITTRPVTIIPNGYDEEELPAGTLQPPPDKLVIGYIGNMYPVKNWAEVFGTIRRWLKDNPELKTRLELKFAGNEDGSVLSLIRENGLEANTRLLGYLPHDRALEELFSCHALLLVVNQEPGNTHVLTGKLFEYLSTGCPILFSGPIPGDAWSLLNQAGNAHRLSETNPADLMKTPGGKTGIEAFTRKNLTRQLAGLLTHSIDSTRTKP